MFVFEELFEEDELYVISVDVKMIVVMLFNIVFILRFFYSFVENL